MAVGKIRATTPGDSAALKKALKETGGGDKWFYRVPADEEFQFRLMVEPYEFTQFKQHFIQNGKDFKTFPCNEGDCDGCDEGNSPSPVWVAPVVDINESRVRVLQVPKSIVESLMKKADRHGTVMDRDWILIREGSGKDNTRYELDSNAPKRRDVSIYELPDIMEMLEAQLEEATGDSSSYDDDDDDEPPVRRGVAKKATARGGGAARRAKPRDVWADEDEEVEDEPRPVRRGLKKAAKPQPAHTESKAVARKVAARKDLRKNLRRD